MLPGLMRRFVLSGAVTLLAACDADLVGPRDFARLAEARALWGARPFADYSYEIRISCFCPPEINRWTRVSVQNGVVIAAVAVEPDPAFPITTISWWDPIDSIFVDLHRSMTERSASTYLEAIVATYDPELGYPTTIEYRAKKNVADGGSTFNLRNVRPLN